MPKGLKNRKTEYIAVRDNTRVMKPDTIKSRKIEFKPTNRNPYGSIPTKDIQIYQRMSNRSKPVVAKAGVTLTNRRYRNGGKTKC